MGDRHLVTVEDRSICLYEVTANTLTLLSSDLKLDNALRPRSDRYGHIYVPHRAGVAVIRIVDNQSLHVDRILTGGGRLKPAVGVAVVTDTMLYVTVRDGDNHGVYLLDVITDTVLAVLQAPGLHDAERPADVAVLSETKLVSYDRVGLMLYTPGETAGTNLDIMGLTYMSGVTIDPAGRFLVAGAFSNTVWVLSVTGEVLAGVESDMPWDVTLSSDGSRLYIGNSGTGEITVLQ